jgi:hypothetical protein
MAGRIITLTEVDNGPWLVDPASIASVTPAADGGAHVAISGHPRGGRERSIRTILHVEESDTRVIELIEQARED